MPNRSRIAVVHRSAKFTLIDQGPIVARARPSGGQLQEWFRNALICRAPDDRAYQRGEDVASVFMYGIPGGPQGPRCTGRTYSQTQTSPLRKGRMTRVGNSDSKLTYVCPRSCTTTPAFSTLERLPRNMGSLAWENSAVSLPDV